MVDESDEQKQSNLLIKGEFGLSDQHLQQALGEARTSSKDNMIAALTSASPAQILGTVRKIYDKTAELEASGISRKELIKQVQAEFPGIENMYWLLRKQPWGYRLGQAITAQKMLDEEEAKYGPQSSN